MLMNPFAASIWHRRVHTRPVQARDGESVFDRHRRLDGYDQERLAAARLLLVGAGGIGSELAYTAVRKGIGQVQLFDSDVVATSNLSRQLFFPRDVGKRKAPCLVRNLAPHATGRTLLDGHACPFQVAIEQALVMPTDMVLCGVDNNAARVAVAQYGLEHELPIVFIAVDRIAEHGYVFVQEPGHACFGCLFPDCLTPREAPCRTPAVIDILKAMAGLAMYAVDSLVMEGRPRGWNYCNLHLAGFAPAGPATIQPNCDCPLQQHETD